MAISAVEAAAITAATMVLIFGICFYFFYSCVMAKKARIEFRQKGRTLKDIVVEENGFEVLYLRKLEDGQLRSSIKKIWFNPMDEEETSVDHKHKNSKFIHKNSLPLPSASVDYSGQTKPVQELFPGQEKSNPTPPSQKPRPPPPPPLPPPPPPPVVTGRNLAPPPPPPLRSARPPTAPRAKLKSEDHTDESSKEKHGVPKKMKPFHWDKVNTSVDHSVVWNNIVDGSLRFDDELIEALFGYKATNRNISASPNSTPCAKITILDPRKSQNTAIVLKSLSISPKEILEALIEGRGLSVDVLEKLTKISPTEEEVSKILQFNGNPTKLIDAESFLYYILKKIPSAFIRMNAMLFRKNYDPEILHFKECLQTLELGCKELRAPGTFLKFLEAILKAGNRMNAGTARGNAKGFNLAALRKLSYVKSTDGKTTLLHFVVEQVVRAEGKRYQDSDKMIEKEEMEKEYLTVGLLILGGLSSKFSNVKKAATINYDNFVGTCPNLLTRVSEIRKLVARCGHGESGGFVKEMKGFLEECEEELKVVREEETRVMEVVKRTTDFYQVGTSKDKSVNPLQIFGFVKDFLDMVDQVCVDLTKKLKKKNVKKLGSLSPATKTSSMFQNLDF